MLDTVAGKVDTMKALTLAALLLLPLSIHAEQLTEPHQYLVEIHRVIDGDTLVISIDNPWRWRGHLLLHLRLTCIDAPEKRGDTKEPAALATDYVHQLGQITEKWVLHTRLGYTDRWGRHLGKLTTKDVDGNVVDMAREVARAGHATWTCEGKP